MRQKILLGVVAVSIFLGMSLVAFPDGAAALLIVLSLSLICLAIFRHYADDKDFVTNVFLFGLILRLGLGIAVHIFDLRDFFGGDANSYDYRGDLLRLSWTGNGYLINNFDLNNAKEGVGWGMNYLVGALY